jgi:hypothetical protein
MNVRTLTIAAAMALATLPLLAQSPQPAAEEGYRLSVGGVDIKVSGSPPKGPAPRLPDGTPDLSGVWLGGGPIANIALVLAPGETIELLPEAKRLMASRRAGDDPQANCLPSGVPRLNPYPWRFVQLPTHQRATHAFILYEGNVHSYRQIFMDGRKHPEDPDPSWYGHSVGRWEGNTLVIDTIGYNDKFWFDFVGTPHTEQLHTIERWTRTDMSHLVDEITIDDPGAYAKPFKAVFNAMLMPPGEELREYICNENNIDPAHLTGPAIVPGGPR